MENMTMKKKLIYTRKLALYLRQCGFKIIGVEINPNHPQFNAWVFEETPELIETMLSYKK